MMQWRAEGVVTDVSRGCCNLRQNYGQILIRSSFRYWWNDEYGNERTTHRGGRHVLIIKGSSLGTKMLWPFVPLLHMWHNPLTSLFNPLPFKTMLKYARWQRNLFSLICLLSMYKTRDITCTYDTRRRSV